MVCKASVLSFLVPGACCRRCARAVDDHIPEQVKAARFLVKALYRWAAPGCPIKRSTARTNAAAATAHLALQKPKKGNLRIRTRADVEESGRTGQESYRYADRAWKRRLGCLIRNACNWVALKGRGCPEGDLQVLQGRAEAPQTARRGSACCGSHRQHRHRSASARQGCVSNATFGRRPEPHGHGDVSVAPVC